MFRVTREISFCYGHRLQGCSTKCRHLHGHNGRAVITLEAPQLNAIGMVMDFTRVKQVVGRWLDENLDHRMVLHRDDPAVSVLRAQGEPVFVMDDNPTAENIARLIFDAAAAQGFPVTEVVLWETDTCFASYSRPR
jgi:6-pyruvoyltetrahydropterin/6-carboxytetrahydropterin synthase